MKYWTLFYQTETYDEMQYIETDDEQTARGLFLENQHKYKRKELMGVHEQKPRNRADRERYKAGISAFFPAIVIPDDLTPEEWDELGKDAMTDEERKEMERQGEKELRRRKRLKLTQYTWYDYYMQEEEEKENYLKQSTSIIKL